MTTQVTTRQEELTGELAGLFLAEGFARFGVGDLAARLRCSRTTLYQVAPSKEQLVLTVLRAWFRGAAARIEARVARASGPAAALRTYLVAVAEELAPASAAFYADLAAHPAAAAVYEENTEHAARRVQQLVRDGVRAGELRRVDAAFVGASVAQVMHAIQRGAIGEATGLDDARAYRRLADLVLDGLRVRPS